jgi:hypothetical protein
MGTLLLLAPMGADYFYQRNLTELLVKAQTANPTLLVQIGTVISQLGTFYRVACWLAGALMVVFGIVGAVVDARDAYFFPRANAATDEDEDDEDEDVK